jgi:hypothetical protein
MLVRDLENIKYGWKIKAGHNKNQCHNKSQLHLQTREILHQVYGTLEILEEVKFRVLPNKYLWFDFFIPLLYMAIEVHGSQHFKFSSLFHKNKKAFQIQQYHDTLKKEWCKLNGITLIEFSYKETPKEWKEKLN